MANIKIYYDRSLTLRSLFGLLFGAVTMLTYFTYLKYGSEEKGSSLCRCSIPLHYVKKPKRFVILSSDKSSERNLSCFFDIKRPRRIEHLQSEEPFSSDPYFNCFVWISFSWCTHTLTQFSFQLLLLCYASLTSDYGRSLPHSNFYYK